MPGTDGRIPTILSSAELLDKAFGKASTVAVTGTNMFDTSKKTTLGKISAVSDILTTTLLRFVRSFPDLDRRGDLFVELIDVLVGVDALKRALGSIDWAARRVSALQREYSGRVRRARSIGEVEEARREFYGRVSSVLDRVSSSLTFLSEAREKLRRLPSIDPSIPTVVVAGSPNVGKSQLIHRLSNARPTIAEYPFTTKGLVIGHFDVGWHRFQIVDTPGLLDRAPEERNWIELQAVLALRHLAEVILFLLDPSETSGYPMGQQLSLLSSIRKSFPGVPVVEVENKVDLVRTDTDRIKISALTGEGIEEVMEAIVPLLMRSLESKEQASLTKSTDIPLRES